MGLKKYWKPRRGKEKVVLPSSLLYFSGQLIRNVLHEFMWVIKWKAIALKKEKWFNLLNRVPCTYSPAWYNGLKKQFGWTEPSKAEKQKIAELDEWAVGITEMHPSALKKATIYIWGYVKDETFLRWWLRKNGWYIKTIARQNTLYMKTSKTKKKVNLRDYFASK